MKCFNSALGLKITSLKKMTIFSREGKAHLHSMSRGSDLAIKALLGGICTKIPQGYPEGLQPMHLEHGHLFWGFKFHVSIFLMNSSYFLFMCVCPAGYVSAGSTEARRGRRNSWSWSYR